MRSRFQDDIPPSRPEPPDEEGKSPKMMLANISLTVLVAALGCLGVFWTLNDVSGEYQGMDQQLGVIHLTLLRKPAGMKGQIFYGRGAPIAISEGNLENNRDLSLTFATAQEQVGAGQTARNAALRGQISDGIIKGTLEEGGFSFPITLVRNKISSIFLQLQSHLPW